MSALQQHVDPIKVVPLRHNRDFLLLWLGQVVSSVGTQSSALAFPLLVLAITRSPVQAGILGALREIPYAILILPAGALIDRWNRKRVMILADAGRALALGSIPLAYFTEHLTLVQLAAASLVEGTLFTFFNLAEVSCLPHVVATEQIPDAVALNASTEHLSGLIGPSLSGALFAAGRAMPFLVDAVSYAASVVSLFFIKTEFQGERVPTEENLWAEIREGLDWLWHHPVLRFLAILVGTLNLFSMGYPLIMIVRAQQLHAGAFEIGLLFATGGLGGILGSFCVAPLRRRFTVGPIMIGATWVWVLGWLPYAAAPNLVILGLANIVGWFIIPIHGGTQFSYRLQVIPERLQGRVNSVYKLIAFGSTPISLALTGVLLQIWGPIVTVLLITAPQAVLAVVATYHRGLRHAPPAVLAE